MLQNQSDESTMRFYPIASCSSGDFVWLNRRGCGVSFHLSSDHGDRAPQVKITQTGPRCCSFPPFDDRTICTSRRGRIGWPSVPCYSGFRSNGITCRVGKGALLRAVPTTPRLRARTGRVVHPTRPLYDRNALQRALRHDLSSPAQFESHSSSPQSARRHRRTYFVRGTAASGSFGCRRECDSRR